MLVVFVVVSLVAEIVAYRHWREWNRPGRVHAGRGAEHVGRGSFSGAEEEWLKGTKSDPEFAENYERLGDLYEALIRYDEAAEMYKKAAELSPQDGNVWLKYARNLNRVSDRQHTIEAARRAAQLLPDNAEAQGQFGLLAAENQERTIARQSLLRAHQVDPNSGSYLAGLVAVELEMGMAGEAEKHVRAFLERHPQHPESNFFLAVIYRQKPHTKENVANAIKHGEKALDITRPGWRILLYELLGSLYLETGQSHKAVKYYELGRKLNPSSSTMASGLMRAYAASGQVARSQQLAGQVEALVKRENRKTYLKHALGFSRKDTKAALELAQIFEAEKDYGNARATYELAINESPANSPNNKEARQRFAAFLQRMQKLAGR